MYNNFQISQPIKKFTSLLFSKDEFTLVKTSYGYTAQKNLNFLKKVGNLFVNILRNILRINIVIESHPLLSTQKIN